MTETTLINCFLKCELCLQLRWQEVGGKEGEERRKEGVWGGGGEREREERERERERMHG